MDWTFRQELPGGVTQVSSSSLNLHDIGLAGGAIQVYTETVTFRMKNEFTVTSKCAPGQG